MRHEQSTKIHISSRSKRINPCRQVLANFPLPPRGESATYLPPALAAYRLSQPHAICLSQWHATHLSVPAYATCYMPISARLCHMLYGCASGMQPACVCRLPFVCFSYRLLACPSGMLLPANSCMPLACPCPMPLACLSHISLACLGICHLLPLPHVTCLPLLHACLSWP